MYRWLCFRPKTSKCPTCSQTMPESFQRQYAATYTSNVSRRMRRCCWLPRQCHESNVSALPVLRVFVDYAGASKQEKKTQKLTRRKAHYNIDISSTSWTSDFPSLSNFGGRLKENIKKEWYKTRTYIRNFHKSQPTTTIMGPKRTLIVWEKPIVTRNSMLYGLIGWNGVNHKNGGEILI